MNVDKLPAYVVVGHVRLLQTVSIATPTPAMQSSGASLTLGSGRRAQVRQHTSHKRTFFFLEQLILKHSIDQTCISIKEMHEARAPAAVRARPSGLYVPQAACVRALCGEYVHALCHVRASVCGS